MVRHTAMAFNRVIVEHCVALARRSGIGMIPWAWKEKIAVALLDVPNIRRSCISCIMLRYLQTVLNIRSL